jgi:hypothetical protein
MKIWKVGQKVEYPLGWGIEQGVIDEIDDCDGKFPDNPWVGIKTKNGRRVATQKTLMGDGVKQINQGQGAV